MMKVRPPAVAGSFYTGDPAELRRQVRGFIDAAPTGVAPPKAVIVPHAGYIYSGPTAGYAYAALSGLRDRVRRVVLLGPAHRVYVEGLAASTADAFQTPLGRVPVDTDAVRELTTHFPFVRLHDGTHAPEHSLEVQLPFLQSVLENFRLVPLVVGDAEAAEVEAVLDHLWGGEETLIVISSDLSHYLDYDTAKRVDGATLRKVLALDPEGIGSEQACGQIPIRGLLRVAARRQLRAELLDHRNSGDTAGPKSQVVGYAGVAFYESAGNATLETGERRTLTDIARSSVHHGLTHGVPFAPSLTGLPERLHEMRATFVTLKTYGELRGCIGTLNAQRPLAEDVAYNAFAAAFRDPRFAPLPASEFEALSVSISVLSPALPIVCGSEAELLASLRPGIDGVVLREGTRTGTFLPAVWESLSEPRDFLSQLKRKAGLAPDYWSPTLRAERYTTESW
jgi:AmmeMemoRadiSam system protein B/AmmeMemoRadiSam system protein A